MTQKHNAMPVMALHFTTTQLIIGNDKLPVMQEVKKKIQFLKGLQTNLGHFVIGCRLMRGILQAFFELSEKELVALCVGYVYLLLTG